MRKLYLILSFFILMDFISIHSLGQSLTPNSFYTIIKNFDLSKVFNPKFIFDDGNEKFERPEILGFIGDNFQRFQIHFTSFKKSKNNPYEYVVAGKTRVKENICSFTGTITVIDATYEQSDIMNDIGFPKYKGGVITAKVNINEDKNQTGSGFITGTLDTDVYFDDKGQIHYNALLLVSDGYSNNQFSGSWTSYKTHRTKKCNWGDFRIPESNGLDGGTGEFYPMEKYLENGWKHYYNNLKGMEGDAKSKESERIENLKWWQ